MRQLWIFCHFVGLNEELVMDTTTFFTHSWFTPGYGKYSGCRFLRSEGLRQGRAGLYPVLFCQPSPGTASGSFSVFFVSIISPVSLWYFSHSYAQMQYPNPFAPEAYLHDTRQQRPAMPHACSEPQSSRRMHCRHTQLSFPSYTSDLVMD